MKAKTLSAKSFMLIALFALVLATFSVGTIFAYTSKFTLTQPINFTLQNCTVSIGSNVLFSSNDAVAANAPNFEVVPVSPNTLEFSCPYSALGASQFTLTLSGAHKATLTKLVAYGAVAYDATVQALNNQNFVQHNSPSSSLTITLLSGITATATDQIVFTLEISEL